MKDSESTERENGRNEKCRYIPFWNLYSRES